MLNILWLTEICRYSLHNGSYAGHVIRSFLVEGSIDQFLVLLLRMILARTHIAMRDDYRFAENSYKAACFLFLGMTECRIVFEKVGLEVSCFMRKS